MINCLTGPLMLFFGKDMQKKLTMEENILILLMQCSISKMENMAMLQYSNIWYK